MRDHESSLQIRERGPTRDALDRLAAGMLSGVMRQIAGAHTRTFRFGLEGARECASRLRARQEADIRRMDFVGQGQLSAKTGN
jgi:hypothetical protein